MNKYTFDDLKKIIDTLTSENGCPWDRVQTHESLKPYIIEESCETIEAINNKDMQNLSEELGDVLLQVFLHCSIAEKNNEFTLSDVVSGISEKMIRRHPNIFSNNSEELTSSKSWEEIKKEEKKYKSSTEVLKNIPKSFPAIMRYQKLLSKAHQFGFKTTAPEDVISEIQQKIDILKEYKNLSEMAIMEYIGSIIADIINFSEIFKINAEFSLTNAAEKFINRFEDFEKGL